MAAMNDSPPVIAVLDDEPRMRSALHRLLATHGYSVENYASGAEFLAVLPTHLPACLVLDLHMPELSGFDVLATLHSQHGTIPVVVITGHDEHGTAERVHSLGASAFLTKPVDETALIAAIKAAIVAGSHSSSCP
jgi:FixJ family two-component response regulator